MSLFGSFMGDMENDPFFGSHMRTMRQMNNMMNSLFGDPFDCMGMRDFGAPALTFGGRAASQNSLLPFGGNFPMMPNINRLLSNSLDSLGDPHGHCYSSSTVVSMTSSGPDGRPHVYKATSSTRTAPGGVRETQKTVCDSRSGTKKMSIGHHIGERAHIIEREQNVHSGDQEERQDFINLDEEEADDFNREWETRTYRNRPEIPRITGSASIRNRHGYGAREHSGVPAITAGSSSRRSRDRHVITNPMVTSRRGVRSNALSSPNTSSHSATRHPYSPTGHSQPKKPKNIKTVSGSPPHDM
ncbi:hypothetical protein FQR65_LT01452 [Abscondita terminalis]|nr:hypothetical protein FQR65_LT01452 [Abscondita terminalis]